jgi:hypothetical protein
VSGEGLKFGFEVSHSEVELHTAVELTFLGCGTTQGSEVSRDAGVVGQGGAAGLITPGSFGKGIELPRD